MPVGWWPRPAQPGRGQVEAIALVRCHVRDAGAAGGRRRGTSARGCSTYCGREDLAADPEKGPLSGGTVGSAGEEVG